MSDSITDSAVAVTQNQERVINVPNSLSAARLLLACVVFALMEFGLYLPALAVFVIAAGTDWVDGWWARKFNQVTQVGRMLDPFVDKIIICGAFIFLASQYTYNPDTRTGGSGVAAWMATIVVGREMLVTALRSMIEASGGDFSAGMAGKLKMVFQCVAVVVSLISLDCTRRWGVDATPLWLRYTLMAVVIVALVSTVQSGVGYVVAAARMMRSAKDTSA